MEVIYAILTVLASLTMFIFAYCFMLNIVLWARRHNLSKASLFNNKHKNPKKQNIFQRSLFGWLIRNGIGFLKKPVSIVLKRVSYLDNLFSSIVIFFNAQKIKTDKVSLASGLLAINIAITLLVTLIFKSIIAGLSVALCLWVLLITAVSSIAEKKNEAFRNSIPDALRSMEACLGSGYTLMQTFEHISNEGSESINRLFGRVSSILQTGGTVKESLEQLKKTSKAPELAFISVALDIQHQTGGSLKHVIEFARDMVESRLELMRLLKIQTAQAKLSARIVTILPFALIAVFSIVSPNFLAPFFESFFGIVLLLIAFIMQLSGVLLVRSILKVEI